MDLQEYKELFHEDYPSSEPQCIMDKGLRRVYKRLYGCDPAEGEMYFGMRIIFYKPIQVESLEGGIAT